MTAPLTGLRVVDLSRILAGPWCTQLLGDLGAEIIKIEHPKKGDDTRQWGPPWLKDVDGEETKESSYYLSANRNKSSVALDIAHKEGQRVLIDLVKKSDIFIENFKVGGLAKYGLDYASLKEINPGLIYVSITGFGQTGPMASQPGYDYLIQGLGGLMSITGQPDGEPGGGPQRVGIAISDITTGLYATVGILSAIHHREKTGEGQYIDLALLDTQVGWLANQASNFLTGGKLPVRTGKWHPNLAPYQPFKTQDGNIIIAVGNDSQFADLCQFIGLGWMTEDEKFATNPARNNNRIELEKLIENKIQQYPSSYWLAHLPQEGVPASAINNIQQTFEMDQVREREMQIELEHPLAGKVAGVANPLKFSATPVEYRNAAPVHGADTEEVLSKVLGYDPSRVTELKTNDVIPK